MNKKKILIIFSMFLMFFCAVIFAGCSLFSSDESPKKGTLTPDMIEIWGTFYYDGTEQTPLPNHFTITYKGNTIASTAFEYEFWDNVEVGTAYVRVTAREDNRYVKGSAVKTFEILPGYGQIDVTTFDELIEVLNGNHYETAKLTQNVEIPEGYTLTIRENKHLTTKSGDITLINNGNILIENDGSLSVYSTFLNKGSITGEGQIYISGVFYNSGSLSQSLKTIQNWGKICSNTELNYENLGPSYDLGVFKLRQQLSNETISLKNLQNGKLVYDDTTKGVAPIQSTYSLNAKKIEYNLDEKIIGNASVYIEADDKDENYYGSFTLEYEIVKGEKTCNEDTFLAAKETGYYNKYTINGTYPSFNEDITINEDETIIVSKSINFYGKLTNNGSIIVNKMATFDGGIENNGTIQAETINARVNATNTGTINYATNKTLHLSISGSLTNSGTIITTTLYAGSSAEISNSGTITIDNSIDSLSSSGFENGSRLVNNSNGVITISGKTWFGNINVSNNGSITNTGSIDIRDNYTDFSGSGTFDNSEGVIWAFDTMQNKGISQNVHFRTRLTDALVELDQDEYVYDTYSHKPLFTIDGDAITVDKYTIRYTRINGTADKTTGEIKNVGKIKTTITISGYEFEYGGSVDLYYFITPASIEVDTNSKFSSALRDANYENIILTADINANAYESLTIQQNQTVDTNGNSLTVSRYTFTNNGTLILSYIGDETIIENCALHVSTTTVNNGTIINNSILYIDTSKNFTNSGSIQNNGQIFTWSGATISSEAGSTGSIYTRQTLTAATSTDSGAVNLSSYEEDYNEGAQICPTVIILNGSIPLDNSDFIIEFSNNINAGTASVEVYPKSDFNHYFVGTTTAHFTINKIAHNISSEINSDNYENYFDDTNYNKYILTANINVRHTVDVPSNLIIEMGEYRFVQSVSYARINLGENVQIFMKTNDISDFQDGKNYQYVATKITLNGNVGTNGTAAVLYHYIDSENFDDNTFFVGENPYTFTLDLNGYNLYAQIQLFQECGRKTVDVSIVNSSTTKKSVVGYSNQYSSIIVNGRNSKDIYVDINNLKLNKLEISGGNVQTINVSNCDIENTYTGSGSNSSKGIALYIHDVRNYYSSGQPACLTITNFSDCSFTGYSAAYIHGGVHTFNNCTFNANGSNWNKFSDNVKRSGNALSIYYAGESMTVDINRGSMSKTATNGFVVETVQYSTHTGYGETTYTQNSYNTNNGYHFAN